MRVEKGNMIPLGYGKYYRSESIVGMEPIEDGRGPGKRTLVHVEGVEQPIVASRSENAILREMVELPQEVTQAHEQRDLLADVLDAIENINPLLRSIIRDQGEWDLDRLEERIREVIGSEQLV